jgi:ATP-binding cassette subfamily B protein
MRGGGGGHPGFRGVDIEAQKKLNAAAPRIPHLRGRVVALFRPYLWPLVATGVLVIVGAAIAVIPPLIVQRIFDDALFPVDGGPPDMPLLWRLVAVMVALFLVSAALGVAQTWFTSTVGNKVTGDLRVKHFDHLQAMELGFFTRT